MDIVCCFVAGAMESAGIDHGLDQLWGDSKVRSPVHHKPPLSNREYMACKIEDIDPWEDQETAIAYNLLQIPFTGGFVPSDPLIARLDSPRR